MSETPAAAKKPADHKPKADKPGPHVAEVRGIKFEIQPEALDDFELLDDLARIDDGDASRVPGVLRRLVGADEFRRAMNACRDKETGRVSVETGAELVGEILEAISPNS